MGELISGAIGRFEVEEIQVGDVIQVDPHACSKFAGCCGRVEDVDSVHAEIVVSRPDRDPANRACRGLVFKHIARRIGRAAWTEP